MTTTRSPEAPSPAELRRLKISPEVGQYLVERGYPLPDCPPRWKTPEPRTLRGAKFSFEHVDRVIAAFKRLRHTKGKWAGRPLTPDPWQVAYVLAPVFGWLRFDEDADRWVRIIRELYVDVPRKNGKSTLLGGIAVYMLAADGESGAEVIAAATSKGQAEFVFSPVKDLCTRAPALKKHVKAYSARIVHPASGSYFQPISAVADAQHGANVHCGVVDELHVHKSPDLVETIETGTGSRDQPLMAFITTADDGKPNTIYSRKRDRVEKLARGVLKNATVYGVIWAAAESDDPFAEATQRKANPGFGVSPTRSYLAAGAEEAKESPAKLAAYQRLHLGIRTKQTTRYVTMPVWDASAGMVDEVALAGRRVFGGLDLSSVEDLSALVWEFPDDAGAADVLFRFWLPEDRLSDLDKRTANAASRWVREGFLYTTPGNVIDLDHIYAQIIKDAARFDVQTLGFDRWGSNPLVTRLMDDGVQCVPRGQGYASASAPLKDILRMLLGKRYRHGGHPVMRWMTDNLAVSMDPSGNVKPNKASAADKIDGWSAAVNAHGEWMDTEVVEAPPAPRMDRDAPDAVTYDLGSVGF